MLQRTLYITILLLGLSCHKESFDIVNLNGNKIDVLGHAGMGISNAYPINSFESISKALAIGADGTEIDIQITKDGVLIAFHDQHLESSTNKSGLVNDLTWAQIEGAYYNLIPYHDYKLIKLESIFKHTDNIENYRFALDCKIYSSNPGEVFLQQYASELVKLLNKYNLPPKTIIESPDPQLLKKVFDSGSDFSLFWYINDFNSALTEAENWPINGFTLRNDQTSEEEVKAVHDMGYLVALYNTQSKLDNREAIKKNPDIIQSDKLKHLIKLLH